jgi:tetratricopeptide (TPR) repeat protein
MIDRRQLVSQVFVSILMFLFSSGMVWNRNACAAVQVKTVPLHFETTSSPIAHRTFLHGLELLHNFQYDDAILTFQEAIKAQPDFPMAYWGLAMSYNHPLWGEQDLETARRTLADFDRLPSSRITQREQAFIAAVRLLYGEGDKAKRDADYAEAMHQLYLQFPDDDEVASFYGLALLGTKAENKDFIVNIKASDVLERVYQRNPNHPGILHYLVHCYDDPKYASLGLQAANRYGQVAPDSVHALHMPSHIYLDLGLWTQYISANEASWKASLSRIQRDSLGSGDHDIHALHTLQWLEYGYLQKGQMAEAVNSLKAMEKIYSLNPSPMVKWYLAMMRAIYIVNAPNWQEISTSPDLKGIESLDLHNVELTAPANNLFATGLMAVRQKQSDKVKQVIGELAALIQDTQQTIQSLSVQGDVSHHHDSFFTSAYASSIKPAQVMQAQLEALQLLAEGKDEDALNQLQDAVGAEDQLPAGYGPPVPVKPSAELLGEVYLRAGLAQNAMRAFQMALLRYPNRAASLAGLSEAARLAGDRETASRTQVALSTLQHGVSHRYQGWKQLPCPPSRRCGRDND